MRFRNPFGKREIISKKILFLGFEGSELLCWLRQQGEEVDQTTQKLEADKIISKGYDFLISYGYRHILKREILDLFPDRVINLHISFLPWNRGADPNFWSFVDNTPKGVTIHYVDEGIDTGDIIIQQEVAFEDEGETLATTYQKLQDVIQKLFRENWESIRNGNSPRNKQPENSRSIHRVRDKKKYMDYLQEGWDTPVRVLEELKSKIG